MPFKWLALASEVLTKLPVERWLLKPRDTSADREELKRIIREAPTAEEAEPEPEPVPPPQRPAEMPKVELQTAAYEGLTTEETVAYQNREISKLLYMMEMQYAQKLKIMGKPCDCGASKHLLGIEGLAEETIPMVSNPDVYYRVIQWVREVSPKSTLQASASGRYDNEYPTMSHQARDFRKDIMGTLDISILWPKSEPPEILPVVSEEEREKIRQLARVKIDQAIGQEENPAPGGEYGS